MLDDRNQTSHVYREEDARKVLEHIKEYAPILQASYEKLHAR